MDSRKLHLEKKRSMMMKLLRLKMPRNPQKSQDFRLSFVSYNNALIGLCIRDCDKGRFFRALVALLAA